MYLPFLTYPTLEYSVVDVQVLPNRAEVVQEGTRTKSFEDSIKALVTLAITSSKLFNVKTYVWLR